MGVGEGGGDATGAWRVKFAQGFGWTLAHSLWTPGASFGPGLTRALKLPLASAVAVPATLFGWSQ